MAVYPQLLCVLGLVSTFFVGILSEAPAANALEPIAKSVVTSSCSLSKNLNNEFLNIGDVRPCSTVDRKSEISLMCDAVRNLTNLLCRLTTNDKDISLEISKETEAVPVICAKFVNIPSSNSNITEIITKSKLSDQEKCKALCDKSIVLCVFTNKIIEDILSAPATTPTTTPTTTTTTKTKSSNPDTSKAKDVSQSTVSSTTTEMVKDSKKDNEAPKKEPTDPEMQNDSKIPGKDEISKSPETKVQPNKDKTNENSLINPESGNIVTNKESKYPVTSNKSKSIETEDEHNKGEADKVIAKNKAAANDELKTSKTDGKKADDSDAIAQPNKGEGNVDEDLPEEDPGEDLVIGSENTDDKDNEKDGNTYDDDTGVYNDEKGNKEGPQRPSIGNKKANAEEGNEDVLVSPDEDLNGEIHSSNGVGVAPGTYGVDPDDGDSHFFIYFLTVVGLSALLYIVFHNKKKILALILEGRNNRGRRPNSSLYRKLDNNLDEVISSSTKKVNTGNIIY